MEKTEISWCDSTINPTSGCDGCELWNGRDIRDCYAGNLHERRLAKSLPVLYAPNFQEVRIIPGRMMKAARWSDLRGKERPEKPWLNGLPRLIFVGDMGDFMSRDVPDDYIQNEIIGAIKSKEGSRHFWLLLTKQIARLAEFSKKIGGLPDNCMAMTTITNQQTVDFRVHELSRVECLWRGVSAEPLFEQITLEHVRLRGVGYYNALTGQHDEEDRSRLPRIDWIVTGGLSGDGARPAHPDWFRSLRDQCARAGVPYHFKQHGTYLPVSQTREHEGREIATHLDSPSVEYFYRVGKKIAGCLLDGVEWKQFPEVA